MRRVQALVGAAIVGMVVLMGVRPAGANVIAPVTVGPPAIGGLPCLPGVMCNPLDPLAGGVSDAVGKAVFDGFVGWVADGAVAVLGHVSDVLTSTTDVNLGADWFTKHLNVMKGLAVTVLLPLVLVGIIGAVIYRDFGRLVRGAVVYVPVALIGGALVVQFTSLALQVTDQMTSTVAADLPASTDRAIEGLAAAARPLVASPSGGLLTVVVLLLLIAGAVFIWIELLIRSSAIYIVVLFLPIALTGLVWPVTARWTRRMIEGLTALILSKFVIVAVISLAADMIADSAKHGGADKLGPLMSGAALLLLAAFAPFALLRLIPIAEAGVIGHLEGMERRPVAAAARATTSAVRLGMAATDWIGSPSPATTEGNGDTNDGPVALPKTPAGQLNGIRAPGEGGDDRAAVAAGRQTAARPAGGQPGDGG